jgi:hypothetical protein
VAFFFYTFPQVNELNETKADSLYRCKSHTRNCLMPKLKAREIVGNSYILNETNA